MTAYAINKVCWLANKDDRFRQRLMVEPDRTLQHCDPPLTDQERLAFLTGDVGTLVALGASRYLLASLGRRNLLGLTRESYRERLRSAYETAAEVRAAMYPGAVASDGN